MKPLYAVGPLLGTEAYPEADAWQAAIVRAQLECEWDSYLPARAEAFSWQFGQQVKRAVDVLGAAVGLVLLSPLFLLIAVLVKATSPGPILHRWWAVGRQAQPFLTYKFRTMVVGAELMKRDLMPFNEMKGPVFKIRKDPRITTVGRWLRKLSLDELPQLWSVLVGHMSLVGPRPLCPEEFAGHKPWQRARCAVTPGLTCLWQIGGRIEIPDFDEWVKLDLWYIENWDLLLDLKILLRTIPAVVTGRGAY